MIHFDSRFGEAKRIRMPLLYELICHMFDVKQVENWRDREAKSTAGVSPTSHQNAAAQPLLIEVNMGMGQYL